MFNSNQGTTLIEEEELELKLISTAGFDTSNEMAGNYQKRVMIPPSPNPSCVTLEFAPATNPWH